MRYDAPLSGTTCNRLWSDAFAVKIRFAHASIIFDGASPNTSSPGIRFFSFQKAFGFKHVAIPKSTSRRFLPIHAVEAGECKVFMRGILDARWADTGMFL